MTIIASGNLPLTGTSSARVLVKGPLSALEANADTLLALGGVFASGDLPLTGTGTAKIAFNAVSVGSLPLSGSGETVTAIGATASGSLLLTGAIASKVTVRGSLAATSSGADTLFARGGAIASGTLSLSGTSTATLRVFGSLVASEPVADTAALVAYTSLLTDLLPASSGAYERTAASAILASLPVPIRQVMSPEQTPVPFLPFLAAHRGVDLWYNDWAESRKRQMAAAAPTLAAIKATSAAPAAFLAYVDGTVVDRIAYPTRFVMNRSVIGRTPIGHPNFTARYLVRVLTTKPPRAFVIGRSPMNRRALKTPSREPFLRCLAALRVSKSSDTVYRVDFAHQRVISIDDAPLMDGSVRIGQYVPRNKL
jgi:P2-related tail formation protein